MKLVSLYIENFGTLSRYALNFQEGLTTLAEPNGFGKTTLAEFIRAMFYGFPRKSKTLDKSLRQKYAPWNGGHYGGNLVFEWEGRRYRVERSFAQTPKGDTFTLMDLGTNRKSDRFPEELGEALFGLDADAFERSVYLPQLRSDGPLATSSIQAKLSGLVEDSADVGNYEKALAALRSKRSDLIPYRGSAGAVAETAAKISDLQLQLDELQTQYAQLQQQLEVIAQAQQELQTIEAQLLQLGAELDLASRQEADNLLRRQYEQLQERHRKTSERLSFYKRKYPSGLPEEQALRTAELTAAQVTRHQNAVAVPDTAQLEYCRRQCDAYSQLLGKMQLLQQRMAELRRSDAQMPKGTSLLAGWILTSAGLGGAIALRLLEKLLYAYVALGFAAAALLVTALLCFLRSRKKRAQRQAREKELADLQRQADAHARAAEKHRAEITAFLSSFDPQVQPERFAAVLAQLEQQSLRNTQLQKQRNSDQRQLQEFLESAGFLEFQDPVLCLKQIRDDLQQVQTVKILRLELEEQLAAMEASYGELLFADPVAAVDLQRLRVREQRLRAAHTEATSRLLKAQQNAQLLRSTTERIPQLQETLELSVKQLEKYRADVRILDAAIEYLQQAKENLATAYMGTIRSRFGVYLSRLEETGGGKFFIDPDLHVQLERSGQARELAHFSAGQTDLVMLCMRFALSDALFQSQQMFVILDDPFVNLDDAHMALAMSFLKQVSSDRQILYLTCHSGRVP